MINYTDILIEAYEDNHIEFLGFINTKEKLSIKKEYIEIMYIQWFLSKAQIMERDYFIESDSFIEKCIKQCLLLMQATKGKPELVEFGFIFTALNEMFKVMNNTGVEQKPFAGLLKELDDKQLEQLFKFLTTRQEHEGNYIRYPYISKENTDRQSFDYIFGKDKEKPENFIAIEWILAKQLLRELLTGLQKEKKYNKRYPTIRELSNEIVRQTSKYFTKGNQPLELAKNKPNGSWESTDIEKFLTTI